MACKANGLSKRFTRQKGNHNGSSAIDQNEAHHGDARLDGFRRPHGGNCGRRTCRGDPPRPERKPDDEREEEMNTKPNPQPFRISRKATLTLPTATTLLLAVVALLLLAAPPRPAEALIPGGGSLAPTLRVDKSSVAVSEGGTVTNTGGYDDLMDTDGDTVRVSASLGTVTQSGTMTGAWNWSYKAPSVT